MSKRFKILSYLILLLVSTTFINGCNIFDFLSDAEKSPTEKAEEAIRDHDYAQAKKELADAVKDSTDSYALYLDAKATLLLSGVNIAEIVELIEGDDAISDSNMEILDFVDELSNDEQNAWYSANKAIHANLKKITSGYARGLLNGDDISFGFTTSSLLSGVFGIRDTNQDGLIDDNDFSLPVKFISDENISDNIDLDLAGGYGFDEGLELFLQLPATMKVADSTYGPDIINKYIAFIISVLTDGTDGIKMLLASAGTGFDIDEIDKYIKEIGAVINFYWYDDGIDNDGDGSIDEEIIDGLDNDNDGIIDEDTGYYGAPIDPSDERNTQYNVIYYQWQQRLSETN